MQCEEDDAGDFMTECDACGAEFLALENVSCDGDQLQCPECGVLSGSDDGVDLHHPGPGAGWA